MAEVVAPSQRRFSAFALPRAGHPEGHAVLLVETCGRSRREQIFSRAEAGQVCAELHAALRAFFVGEELSEALDVDAAARVLVGMVADAFGYHRDLLTGQSKTALLVRARNGACWLLRERFALSSKATGRFLGGRDHKTVLHALGNAERDRERDPTYRAALDALLVAPIAAHVSLPGTADQPRACTAPYPFTDHKTLEEVGNAV